MNGESEAGGPEEECPAESAVSGPRLSSRRRRAVVTVLGVFLLYTFLSFIGFLPGSLHLFHDWFLWFEDPTDCYRVWWFSQIIYGHRAGSIWFMPDLLYPFGIPTMMQSNGLGKELLAALLGGGVKPWLTGNIIALSTPVTVATVGFVVLRKMLRGAILPALAAAWYIGWSSMWIGHTVSPWIASCEGLVVYVWALLKLRQKGGIQWAIVVGAAAALAIWLQIQQMVYVVILAVVYLGDRRIAGDWKKMPLILLSAAVALILTAPLLFQTWVAYHGRADLLGGSGFKQAIFEFRNRLSQLIFPVPRSLPYGPITTFLIQQGADVGPGAVAYPGWGLVVMALIGWRTRHRGTGFLAVASLVSILLSFGPVISLGFKPNDITPIWGPTWIPGPFYFLRELPLLNSMRVPCRFILIANICMGFLAGYGILHFLRDPVFKKRSWLRPSLVVFLLAFHMAELNVWPLHFAPSQYSPFFKKVAEEPNDFAILDAPYARGMQQYSHYGAYHHHRVIWGFGSRVPDERLQVLENAFAFPGIVQTQPATFRPDYKRFARSLLVYHVKYVFWHELQLERDRLTRKYGKRVLAYFDDTEAWSRQPYIELPKLIYSDKVLRVYQIIPKRSLPRPAPASTHATSRGSN